MKSVKSVFFMLLFLLGGMAQAEVSKKPLPPIKRVISFGDSLTDAGTYGFRFTTNPGFTWAQHVALHFGQEPLPNQHVISYSQVYKGLPGLDGPGGYNYAQGGARANSAYSQVSQNPEGVPISTKVQVQRFIKQHHRFESEDLVTLFVGTNDVAYNYDLSNDAVLAKQLRDNVLPSEEVMKAERSRVITAAKDTAHVARDILDNGAERLMILKLVDMGGMPWFRSQASQTFMSDLSALFNKELVGSLPKDSRILIVDAPDFIGRLVKDAGVLGFKYGLHEDACKELDQDYCYPDSLKSPDADKTYIYAAGEHMATKTNELLAEYVLEKLSLSDLK